MSIYSGPADWWTDGTNDGRTYMATKGVSQNGLVFNIDAGVASSYPGSGAAFNDIKNGLNLTLFNGVTYNASDCYGALVFNGTNQYGSIASVPLASPISVVNNFTIEQVYKPTAFQTSNYFGLTNLLLQKGTAGTYNYATQATSSTQVSFIKRTSPEGLQYNTFTVPDMTNRVCFLTFVIENGSNSAIDTVSCYMNGRFIETQQIAGAAIAAVDNDPVYLGGLGSTQYTMLIGSYITVVVFTTGRYQHRRYSRILTHCGAGLTFDLWTCATLRVFNEC